MTMDFAGLIEGLPEADLPLDGVTGHMLRSEDGLAVFFHFEAEAVVPPHSHGAQWGTVLSGTIELTIDGVTRTYRPGESYHVGAGEVHSARIPAGTKVLDVFAETDRYPPKSS